MPNKEAFMPEEVCSICGSEYDDDAGGIQGYFGICPVTFCEWCYSSIYSMILQDPEVIEMAKQELEDDHRES